MLVADRAQALEVALGRRIDPDRAGDRLDDHRCDGRRVVQRAQALEVIGQMRAPFGLAARKRVVLEIERVSDVIDAVQHRPEVHRLATMPPTEMPPKPTPWLARSRPINR